MQNNNTKIFYLLQLISYTLKKLHSVQRRTYASVPDACLNNNQNEKKPVAIYHLNIKFISRSKGRKAVAAAAYRRASKFFDEQCNRTWNYQNKPGVVHSEITVPGNAPSWATKITSEHLWNLVEKSEKRIDAQVAKEVEFSLPVELTQEQSILLAREFIKDQFASRGMLADWSVHWDNPENPHVHVMLTTRELTQSGFGNKVREWNDKSLLFTWREKWAEYANFHLKLHQHNIRIDHRSYKDQGIDLIPTIHQGRYPDRKAEFDDIKKENLKKILKNPELLAQKIFQGIENHESVFSERDLAGAVLTYANNKTEFDSAMEKIKQSKDLIYLGQGQDGRERYTTRRMFDIENSIQATTEKLQKRNHIRISDRKINKALEKYQTKIGKKLTSEQRIAMDHMVSKASIACVIGRAGTGKSFTLGAANAVWKAKGLNVYGITPTGKAARTLQKESGIPSRTIESFRFCVENGIITLTPRDVIVMDEAGMTDCIAMEFVLKAVYKTKAKLALVGDHAQLQPVGPGSAFRALLERLHLKHEKLQHVYRQNHEWQREATTEFSKGKTREAIEHYYKNGFINIMSDEHTAKQKLMNDWHKDCLVLAHRNKDVNELNNLIRQKRIHQKEITEGHAVNSVRGVINISQGDRILFLLNDKAMGVSNGHFGEIKNVNFTESGKVLSFTAILDDDRNKEITVDPRTYRDFTLGYAATVHKSQGATVDHSLVYLGGRYWNQYLTYVAMSRHKESCHVYVDRNTHKNIEVLKNNISRAPRKDSVLDYPLAFSERRGIDIEGLLQRLPEYISEKLKAIHNKFMPREETLNDLLKRYVDYQMEQEKLIRLIGTTKFSAPEESKVYSHQYRENKTKINDFMQEMIKRHDVQENLAAMKNTHSIKPIQLSERGGLTAIAERIAKNEIEQQDMQALMGDIRGKILVANRVQSQEQDRSQGRGGRTI